MMTGTREDHLNAKVKAVNTAHAVANEWFPKLREYFAPFVGKQVFKKEGGFLEKVKKGMPKFPNDTKVMIYRHTYDYSLAFTVKTCEMCSQHGCLYFDVTFYVGTLDHGVLTKLADTENKFRTDFTAAEVTQKRAAYEAAKKLADTARSNLYPFGEMDT